MDQDEKECPFCFETIKQMAIKCKHCGSTLNQTSNKSVGPVYGLEKDEKLKVRQEALVEAEVEWQYKKQKRIETAIDAVEKTSSWLFTPRNPYNISDKTRQGCGVAYAIFWIIVVLILLVLLF
jgi:hypothetical protein